MKLILGSKSPRRKELLEQFSLNFSQVGSNFDESTVSTNMPPEEYVVKIAEKKAEALEKKYFNELILTADTAVFVDNTILGKPKDTKDHKKMLVMLSGKWHEVYTAVCCIRGNKKAIEWEKTRVFCSQLTPDEMHRYMSKLHLQDKAGGYAIQKSGALFVEKIEGSYDNVIGLPIHAVKKAMRQVGVDLWDYLLPF